MESDHVPGKDVGIEPYAPPAGRVIGGDGARGGFEPVVRILGVDPALDGHAPEPDLPLL